MARLCAKMQLATITAAFPVRRLACLSREFPAGRIIAHGDISGLSKGPFEKVIALFAASTSMGGVGRLGHTRHPPTLGGEVSGRVKSIDGIYFIVDG